MPVLFVSVHRDQSRMWEQQQPGYGQLNKLMPDTVFSYSSNFSLMLSTTKEYLPEVRHNLPVAVPCKQTAGFSSIHAESD